MFKTLILAVVVIGLAAAGLTTFQAPIAKAFIEAIVPRPPALLRNASLDDPDAAVDFRRAFPDGSDESKLRAWLTAEKFSIRESAEGGRFATRDYKDSKCGMTYKIYWRARSDEVISNVQVYGGPALCF